jgi:hypothetical protein
VIGEGVQEMNLRLPILRNSICAMLGEVCAAPFDKCGLLRVVRVGKIGLKPNSKPEGREN